MLVILNSRSGSDESDRQLRNLVGNGWARVLWIRRLKFKVIDELSVCFNLILLVFRYRGKCKSYCFGEYRIIWSHLLGLGLGVGESILLDDGAVTISIQQQLFSGQSFVVKKLSVLDKLRCFLFRALFSVKLEALKVPNLYSFFDFTNMLVEGQVNYKRLGDPQYVKLEYGVVYFFGSKYSEAGLMGVDEELRLILRALSRFEGEKVLYFSHRDDSSEKLQRLVSCGVNVISLNQPAETYFGQKKEFPSTIAGFWTTVLYSLSSKYKFARVVSFDNSSSIKVLSEKERAKVIYDYYKCSGIEVVEEY